LDNAVGFRGLSSPFSISPDVGFFGFSPLSFQIMIGFGFWFLLGFGFGLPSSLFKA
jgi:hypothetical protein